MNNISSAIQQKRSLKLHNQESHPLCMLKREIQTYLHTFEAYDHLSEVVPLHQNFDDLRIPKDHPSRRLSDTYYVNATHVLRTHTSAHQTYLLQQGVRQFLVTGEVYRKDTIDRYHYPIFHQMEIVKIVEDVDPLEDLVHTLSRLIEHLLPGVEYKILDDSFPFTEPSIQVDAKWGDHWVELLGAGVIHPEILDRCEIEETGWAVGLGLDRILMQKCEIPDIRYLWTEDPRFLRQYANGLVTFRPYSKYPPVYKDVSFWVEEYQEHPEEAIWDQYYDLCELVRELGNGYIEEVQLLDVYRTSTRTSLAYRVVYRSNSGTLTHEEINRIQDHIRDQLAQSFAVELR
ncbi:MAG: hypothetical protein AAF587_23335 [Bacteroidota bacterium]